MAGNDLSISKASLEFTGEEINLFQRRYEEAYDIPGDSRYEMWLEMCHRDVSVSRELFPQSMQSPHETDAEAHEMDGNQPVEIPVKKAKLGHILKVPAPLGAQKSHETRGARVLTSSVYLAEIEEKERLKQEKAEKVEQPKQQREEKARLRAAEKAVKAARLRVAEKAVKAAARVANHVNRGVVRCLHNRARGITSTQDNLQKEVDYVARILKQNGYPANFIHNGSAPPTQETADVGTPEEGQEK